MQGNEQAFTLIELLVVVLIIGILATVALPQYQVAVAKSRYATIMTQVKHGKNLLELYYLENGDYPDSLEETDFEISGCTLDKADNNVMTCVADSFYYHYLGKNRIAGVRCSNTFCNVYEQYLDHSANPSKITCYASVTSQTAQRVCLSLGGSVIASDSSWTYYQL